MRRCVHAGTIVPGGWLPELAQAQHAAFHRVPERAGGKALLVVCPGRARRAVIAVIAESGYANISSRTAVRQ